MDFNSFEYLIFLPVVFLLYWFLFRTVRWRNLFLVAASYVFYGWWDWRFLGLIMFSTLTGYVSGLMIGAANNGGRSAKAKMWLWLCVGINLGILFLFKYFDFFVHSFQRLLGVFAYNADWVTLNLVLPIGISFYTFQVLSYVIDVYRGDMKPTHDAGAFFAYISFFPQLVAGPIERATNLIPQFLRRREFRYDEGVEGLRMILWGLFKKMVVADNCAVGATYIFGHYEEVGALNLWVGMILFAFQIYGDFSGYSDIAVGSARLFGIRLMQNFRTPYFSRNMTEFWRRWHISLSQWFRDYIYIPLGGSRCSSAKTARNLLTIFLVSGLWHGAQFTFVAWGAAHALCVIPESLWRKRYKKRARRDTAALRDIGAMVFTFLIVAFIFIFFRASYFSQAIDYIRLMFCDFRSVPLDVSRITFVWIAVMIVIEWITRDRKYGIDFPYKGLWRSRVFRWTFYLLMTVVILVFFGERQQFVYFQF